MSRYVELNAYPCNDCKHDYKCGSDLLPNFYCKEYEEWKKGKDIVELFHKLWNYSEITEDKVNGT